MSRPVPPPPPTSGKTRVKATYKSPHGLPADILKTIAENLRSNLAADAEYKAYKVEEDLPNKKLIVRNPRTPKPGVTITQKEDDLVLEFYDTKLTKPVFKSLPHDLNVFTVSCNDLEEAKRIKEELLAEFGDKITIDFESKNEDIKKLNHKPASSPKPTTT